MHCSTKNTRNPDKVRNQGEEKPTHKGSEILSADGTDHAGDARASYKARRETLHRFECRRESGA